MSKVIKRSIALFTILNMLMFIARAVIDPYWSSYYYSFGLSSSQIGYLMAIGPFGSILIQPIWAGLCDKIGKRSLILRIILFGGAVSVLLYLLDNTFSWFLVCSLCYAVFNTSIMPLCDAESMTYLAKNDISFSRVRIGGTIGYLTATLIAGAFLRNRPYLSFYFNAIVLIVMFILVFFLPKQDAISHGESSKINLRSIFNNKAFVFVLFLCFLFQIGYSYYSVFIGVVVKQMGYGSLEIGIGAMLTAVSEIPILFFIDKLVRRFKVIPMLLFAGVMLSLRLIALLVASSLLGVMAAQLMQGCSYMIIQYCAVTFAHDSVDETLKSSAQGCIALVQVGIGTIVGVVGGGGGGFMTGSVYIMAFYASLF
jgi:MFS family permease